MDTNSSVNHFSDRPLREHADGSGVKMPSPWAGQTTPLRGKREETTGTRRAPRRAEFVMASSHGVARRRLYTGFAINGLERDFKTVLLGKLDQTACDGYGRLALTPLELRDGRLPQIEAFGEGGLREPEALADAGDSVHGIYSSPTTENKQQPDCLLVIGSTYIVPACQQNH